MSVPSPAPTAAPREAASQGAPWLAAPRRGPAAAARRLPPRSASAITAALLAALVCTTERAALAGPCEDIGAILDAGLGPQAAVETIRTLQPTFTPADFSCLQAQGAPTAVLEAARPLVREPAPTPAPAAPRAPATPTPAQSPTHTAVVPDLRGLRAELLRMEAEVPDSGVAAALAVSVGFGSGHFYAGKGGAGALFMGADALGAGLLIGGATDQSPSRGATIAGLTVLAVSRLIQPSTAALAAKRRRVAWIQETAGSR